MKAFIDAPLLIYLNTVETKEIRSRYEDLYLDVMTRYRAYTDVLVLDELIYVSRRKYGIPYDVSIEFVESAVLPFLTLLKIGEEEYSLAAEVMRRGLKPSDAIHLGVMGSNGIETIVSEDSEFDRIDWVKRIW